MKRFCFFLESLFVGLTLAFSQSAYKGRVDQSFLNDFVNKNWTTADGLPGMTCTCIMQDKKGYIYLGSYDGLVRFDGVEFATFNRSVDDKYEFTSVRSIYQDGDSRIWIGHNDEGLSCLYPDGKMVRYSTEKGLPNNSVRALCSDHDGNIWVGTAAGLCYINKENEIVIPNGVKELGQETIMVSKLYCDTAGRIWITTAIANDLFVWSNKRIERFAGITKIKDPSVNEVSQDKSGAFWFGVAPHYAVCIKGTEETVYNISHDHQEGSVVNAIVQDNAGNIWFGSDSGLTILHNGLFTYYDKRNGMPDDYINDLIQDREGNIWLIYNRGGIEKMSQGKFRTVTMETSVNAICEDKLRNVTWLGADDGLHCYKDGSYIENEITDYFKGARVRHVEFTEDKELLVSVYTSISQVRIRADGSMSQWGEKDGLAGKKCRVAIKTSEGDYYIGTTQGLTIIDHKDGSFFSFTRANGFENEFIMAIKEDNEGRIWVGTDGGGIYVLKDKQIVKHYTTEQGLVGNVIFKFIDIEDSLWIGTGAGVSKFLPETDTFFNLDVNNGLVSGGIFQMIPDYTQTIWMLTNKGVISVPYTEIEALEQRKIKRISVKYYGNSDGLITGGVTSTSQSMQDSNGRIWFTLVDGFAIYDPVKSGKNLIAPKIDIQNYSIDNTTYNYYGDKIVMQPSAKRLRIKYTGLSFISSDSMKFKSKLEGFEKEFSDWESIRTVSYTNLKPGTYHFLVKSQNSDEIESSVTSLTVIKKPYIWQLVWFWIVIGILVVGIVVLAVFLKIRSMKVYQAKLERTVEERTHDLKLEKEKTESLLLNILPAEVAKELTNNPGKTIARNLQNITVLFTDIVGFTKMSDGMKAEELVEMLNSMIEKFDLRAQREGIEKIKTIGDAYMAATGFEDTDPNAGALRMVRYAFGLIEDVKAFNDKSNIKVGIRLGINTGNLVGGVIGKTKWIYDIWGDTVNVASRMESTGVPMKIHVTESTYNQTKDKFTYSDCVEVEVKGKGSMKTYFL